MRAKITAQFVKDLINGKIADFTTFPPTKETEIRDTELAGFALIAFPSSTVSFIFRYRNAEGKARKLTIGKYGKNMTVPAARQEAESRSPVAKSGVDVHSQKKEARRRAERVRQQTLGVFFEERYQPYCQAHMKSETANNRAWVIKHYFVEHWADKPLTEINQWLVTSWRRKKLKDGLKPGGVNRPIAALKALLNRAVEWQVIDVNPLAGMKQLKEDRTGVVRYLSEDEENRLRAALDKRQDQQRNERESHIQWQEERHLKAALSLTKAVFTDHIKPIVLLALNTGMRRGEIFSLGLQDVNLKQRQVTVQGDTAKSGNSRAIPLNDEAMHALASWIDEQDLSDLVFPSPKTGKRLDNITTAWRNVMKDAGIQNFRFHDTRHDFASKLVMKSVDLYSVQRLLGHTSIEMTQRYAHLAPDHLMKAVEVLNATEDRS